MPYTVTREGGIGEYEFEAYVRQLTRWGIGLGRTLRAPDPQTGRRWLPVWEARETAEKFAQDLSREEDYNDWRIEEVPASAVSDGALGPLDVYLSRNGEGLTFALHPNSRKLLRQRFPRTLLLQMVYVGTDDRDDFEQNQTAAQDRVVQLLTGLSEEQVEELGGYRIYDPVRKRVVRESRALPGLAALRGE